MKAILKYPLYRRPRPTNEVEANNYLPRGSVIDVEKIVQGKAIDNISSWYKATDGFYYWGGGINVLQASVPAAITFLPPQAIDYASLYKEFGKGGQGVKVGILDCGFFDHGVFNNTVKVIKDFTVTGGTAEDTRGHGTHVAGIIGARFHHESLPVLGVAPECEIIIGKVLPDVSGKNDTRFIADGIKWAITQGVNVLNLSLGITDADIPLLKPVIRQVAGANIIIVAAAGDVRELDDNAVQYPAAEFDSCISVAGVSLTYLNSNPSINPRINFLSGYAHYMSASIPLHDFYEPMRGSSMATAFVTGLAARILSEFKSNGRDIRQVKKDEILAALSKITVPASGLNFQDFSSFKIATI